ncbi:MAG: putative phosphohydrolase [Homoserinimonas sp.]|nr:putative phosphohydrolase [Homoserinimonas sp.]
MSILRSPLTVVASFAVLATACIALGGVRHAEGAVSTVRFTASGDFSSSAAALSVLEGIGAINPDLHLALGDLSYGIPGQEQSWCDLVTSRVGAGFPFELLAGNHESDGKNGNINDFASCLPNQLPGIVGTYGRQYYVDVPAKAPLVRYIMVSPGLSYPGGYWPYAQGDTRYAWTSQAIDDAHTKRIPWLVVGMHVPCLSIGIYECRSGEAMMNLMVTKNVDLVLSGHEHLYQRTHQLGTTTGCPQISPNIVDPDCIIDADTIMVKGAGTVFATVGTGGVRLRAPNLLDAERGYFGSWSGRGANPTYGSLDITATSTTLTAAFARASGGTFDDRFILQSATSAATCGFHNCSVQPWSNQRGG